MAYNTKNLKLDAKNKPIPQYWDAAADDYQPMSNEVEIPSKAAVGSDTITRPANVTPYDANDVISTAGGEILEFTNMGAAGDVLAILGVDLMIAQSAIPTGCQGYRLHLYNAAPTAIADAAAYNLPSGDRAKSLGWVDLGVPTDLGDTVMVCEDNKNRIIKLAGTSLYGILQAKGAETPASGAVYTLTVKVVKM